MGMKEWKRKWQLLYIGLGFRVGMKEWKRTCQLYNGLYRDYYKVSTDMRNVYLQDSDRDLVLVKGFYELCNVEACPFFLCSL